MDQRSTSVRTLINVITLMSVGFPYKGSKKSLNTFDKKSCLVFSTIFNLFWTHITYLTDHLRHICCTLNKPQSCQQANALRKSYKLGLQFAEPNYCLNLSKCHQTAFEKIHTHVCSILTLNSLSSSHKENQYGKNKSLLSWTFFEIPG